MKLVLEFKDAAEKAKVLENITYLLEKPAKDEAEVISVLMKHLEGVLGQMYVEGGLRKAQTGLKKDLSEEALTLLRE